MVEPLEQLKTTLKQQGYSLTAVRREVFTALQDQEPQTMRELVQHCQTIDRASIYRCIALYERMSIVHRLQIGWKYKLELTDQFMHHHHHLSCVRCGRIIPLAEDSALEQRLIALAQSQHFLPQDHQLEIRGWCDQCQQQ
jgi:Fur family ferric uptake transcriptional regulator